MADTTATFSAPSLRVTTLGWVDAKPLEKLKDALLPNLKFVGQVDYGYSIIVHRVPPSCREQPGFQCWRETPPDCNAVLGDRAPEGEPATLVGLTSL